jgi:DEAD/DEAH box helicase
MAESPEQVLAKIRAAVEPGHRGRLTARGMVRAMVWRQGVTPPEHRRLGPSLTQELLSYGYALLRLGLKARELQLTDETVFRAFELAATSMEGVVKNGDPADEARGFYRVTAAAAYHLGRFSARAYSLLHQSLSDANVSSIEHALALLILRKLDDLDDLTLTYIQARENSDDVLMEGILDFQSPVDLDDALVVCLTENYLRALAAFVFGIRTGEVDGLGVAQERLSEGEGVAFVMGFVPIWWIYRLTRFLVEDLWQQSMRQLLPNDPNGSTQWSDLREMFIASLAARSTAELELWPSQLEIASRVSDDSDDIIASLPTSAGKTRIAELCILRALANGQRVICVTPLRSLSAQTERTLRRTFTPLGFEVSALYGSAGSSSFDTDSLATREIVVSTPEKLDFALRNNPGLLDDVGLIVLDEGHMLGPSEREIRYEVLVQRLLRRSDASKRRLVRLSAMLPSGDELSDFVSWIRSDEPGEPIRNEWRPTRLRYGEITWHSNFARYELRIEDETSFVPSFVEKQVGYGKLGGVKEFPSSQNDLALASAWRLVDESLSVLVYCPRKASVGALAKRAIEVVKQGFLRPLPRESTADYQKALDVGREWLGAEHPAVKCLELGMAIHHASLPRAFLREIDTLLQQRQIKMIIASPTLSRGLNLSASCVLFQSCSRGDKVTKTSKLISPEEFANVAGRAGRAFVDVEGQVLGVCFNSKQLEAWNQLLAEHAERKLESGLIKLVEQLWHGLKQKLPSKEDPVEYVFNNSQVWEPPPGDENDIRAWQTNLAILDTALLSLIGDLDCDADKIASALDSILASSFLRKRLLRRKELTQRFVNAVLESRARHIWANSSQKQRKGYFFSGVGLNAGRFLDEHAPQLNEAVLQAEQSLRMKDGDNCISGLLTVAKIVFEIEPFQPSSLPENWEKIAVGWLQGETVSSLRKISEDAVSFIEDALVYRLVWAVEAIRVRSRANEEQLFGEQPSPVIAAIETGTVLISASILVQAGLPSRVAAIKTLEDFPAEFETLSDMRQWLFSDEIQAATNSRNWPTRDTTVIWKDFVDQQRTATEPPKRIHEILLRANFVDGQAIPDIGTPVLILKRKEGDQPKIYSPDVRFLGVTLDELPVQVGDWVMGYVNNPSTVRIRYTGTIQF